MNNREGTLEFGAFKRYKTPGFVVPCLFLPVYFLFAVMESKSWWVRVQPFCVLQTLGKIHSAEV